MAERLYRESIRFDLAAPEAFANPADPQIAELNNATLVWNITCALDEDGTEFTLGDPDTDDSLSFCDAAGNQSATFKNPSVNYQYYLDEDRAAAGVYALARKLLSFADSPYIGILRVGYDSDVAYAAGHRINMVGGLTDVPVSVEEGGSNARQATTLLPDGFVNWGFVLD
jgi:hypothetical protein